MSIPTAICAIKMENREDWPCPYCTLYNWPELCRQVTGKDVEFQGCRLDGISYYWTSFAPSSVGKELQLSLSDLHSDRKTAEEKMRLGLDKAVKALRLQLQIQI